MSEVDGDIYLRSCLMHFDVYLRQSDVSDIYINRPGEFWCERLGGAIERHEAPDLTRDLLLRLARQVAAFTAQGINRTHPILSGTLPTGERIQIVIPPATRGEPAIAIRKHGALDRTLNDYADDETFHDVEIVRESHGRLQAKGPPLADMTPTDLLRAAVRHKRNILVSGGTSSGKTTFLNALLGEVATEERLILIEDTPELRLVNENAVGLITPRSELGEAKVSAEDLLIASLRMRPDRIILGEIRGSEAATFLRAVNTGHPGSMTSIHADSPTRAIDQLALLVVQTGIRMQWDDVITYVRRSIDLVVQLERGPRGRRIREILLCHE